MKFKSTANMLYLNTEANYRIENSDDFYLYTCIWKNFLELRHSELA